MFIIPNSFCFLGLSVEYRYTIFYSNEIKVIKNFILINLKINANDFLHNTFWVNSRVFRLFLQVQHLLS